MEILNGSRSVEMCAWFFKTELSNERRARVYEDECQNEERWKKRSSAEKLREKLICQLKFMSICSRITCFFMMKQK